MDCSLSGSSIHGILDKNTGVGCHFLLQGIFLTQELNLGLLHCRKILYDWAMRKAHLLSPPHSCWQPCFWLHGGMRAHSLSCVWLFCDPTGCSPQGSSLHGVLQARKLEWVAVSFSRGSSWPRDWTQVSCVSCIGRRILYHWATWEASVWKLTYTLHVPLTELSQLFPLTDMLVALFLLACKLDVDFFTFLSLYS